MGTRLALLWPAFVLRLGQRSTTSDGSHLRIGISTSPDSHRAIRRCATGSLDTSAKSVRSAGGCAGMGLVSPARELGAATLDASDGTALTMPRIIDVCGIVDVAQQYRAG